MSCSGTVEILTYVVKTVFTPHVLIIQEARSKRHQSQKEDSPQPKGWKPASTQWSPPEDEYKPPQSEWTPPKEDYKPPTSAWRPPTSEFKVPKSTWKPQTTEVKPPKSEWKPSSTEVKVPTPVEAPEKEEGPMGKLIEMGFTDREANKELLEAFNNDLAQVIPELLSMGYKDSSV